MRNRMRCADLQDGPGVLSAREFVWWYNGHPDASSLSVDLSRVRSVAVCGIGVHVMTTQSVRDMMSRATHFYEHHCLYSVRVWTRMDAVWTVR